MAEASRQRAVPARRSPERTVPWWTGAVLLASAVFFGLCVTVGADAYWAVALGRMVRRGEGIPDGVPFAAVPSGGWPNVVVVGEVVLAAAAAAGPVGLAVVQLAAVATALVLSAVGARREGGGDRPTAVVLVLVALGGLPALVVMTMQAFSLLLFPVLLLLLRRDERRPGRRIWWVVPLVALWGNLHGAVLVGVSVVGAYLLFHRLRHRPAETLAVGVATLGALLVNPAGWRTVGYYAGVLGNEAARRGTEQWARPDVHSGFGVLLVATGLVLTLLVLWGRPPLWQGLVLLALAGATALSARNGVWLLLFCAAPAARALSQGNGGPRAASGEGAQAAGAPGVIEAVAAIALVAGVAAAATVAVPGDQVSPSSRPEVAAGVREVAAGRPVLADEPLAESLGAAGVTVWMSDPIDAFAPGDQTDFLDFLAGRSGQALDNVPVVVVTSGSPAEGLAHADTRFAPVRRLDAWVVYARVG